MAVLEKDKKAIINREECYGQTAPGSAGCDKKTSGLTGQTPQQLIHELQVHLAELETQADELRKRNNELEVSRSKYRDYYDFAPDGYLTLNDKAIVVEANLMMATLLGVNRRDLIRQRFRKFVACEDLDSWNEYFICVAHTGEKHYRTITLVRNDKSSFPTRMAGRQYTGENGAILIDFAISDISSLKETEGALRESERFLKMTESLAKVGGWKANPHTNYFQWTNGMYDILEAPVNHQPDFREGLQYFSNNDLTLIRKSIETCLATGDPFTLEVRVTTGGGKGVWTELRGLMPATEDGRTFVIGTLKDITRRRLTEDALKQEIRKIGILAESARLLMGAENPEAIVQTIGEELMHYLGCDTFFNYIPDESGKRMRLNAYAGIPGKDARRIKYLDSGNAVCSRVVRGYRQTVVFDLIKIEDEKPCQIYPSGLSGWLYYPIMYHGRLFGTLSFGNSDRSSFTDDELNLVKTATDLMATALARNIAENYTTKTAALLNAALNATTDGILAVDTNGHITSYNKTFCLIWGIPDHLLDAAEEKAALAYMTPMIADPEQFTAILEEYYSHPGRESYDTVRLTDGRLFERYSKPQKIENTIIGRVWSYRDITERKQAEDVLQETLQRFYDILSKIRYGMLLVTADNRVEFVNPAFCDTFDLTDSPEDLQNLSFMGLVEKIQTSYRDPETAIARVREIVYRANEVKGEEICLRDGRTFLRDFIPLHIDKNHFDCLWIHIDITERKRAEVALKKSEAMYHLLADNSTDVIWTLDLDGNITYASPAVFQLIGYTQEEVIRQPVFNWIAKGSRPLVKEKINTTLERVAAGIIPPQDMVEIEMLRQDGTSIWAESAYRLIVNKNGNPAEFSGVSRNITKRKKIEMALQESLEKFRIIATNTPDMILVQDKDHRYILVINPMPGMTEQEMLGHTDYEIFSKETADRLTDVKRQAMMSGTAVHLEIPLHTAGGETFFYAGSYVPKRNISGEIDGLIGYFTNVTEIKKINEKVVANLAEKETLIREVHHRVKNNLQIIYGLLYMTTKRTQDTETTGILTDMMLKIKTMAQIHTRLYESKRFDRINMAGQIKDQMSDLSSIYGKAGAEITCTMEAEDFVLPVDVAIPCALVINEVLSNAFKHAFRGRRQGTLRISVHQSEGNIHIRIEDNGIGIPKDVDVYRTASLGMKLIRSLMHQLEGSLVIESSDRGSNITLGFPVKMEGG